MDYSENNNSDFFNIYHDIIECLISALEARDKYTSGHSKRVADMAYDLAKLFGIKDNALEEIHMAAHVHDIGKIGIPDSILNKPGKLTEEEWLQIKRHPEIGHTILNSSHQLSIISEMVLHHHERWDGTGYPRGLKSSAIPLGSRIIAICDAIDAMTTTRSYTSPLSWEQCKAELERNKGTQFDPSLIDLLICNWQYWFKFHPSNIIKTN